MDFQERIDAANMKIENEKVEFTDELPKPFSIGRLTIYTWNDWRDLIRPSKHMNWRSMDVVRVYWERAYYKDTFEVSVSLLGFSATFEWYFGRKKQS